jgi:predicted nucleotidyltransferase
MGLKVRLEEALGATVDILVRSACKPRFLRAIQEELLNVA